MEDGRRPMATRFIVRLLFSTLHPRFLLSTLLLAGCARAEAPAVEHPYAGVTYRAEVRKDPAQRLFWANVDLAEPRVLLDVSAGGGGPAGDGQRADPLQPPARI